MTKKPFYNAVLAAGYISSLVSFLSWLNSFPHSPQDNIFMPITMLSFLVLSVALMAYLFFYQPVLMIVDGKRAEAAKLLLQTIAIFAALTVAFFAVSVFLIPS